MSRTVRTVTLAETEGMPTITAPCLPYRWNGWYVPVITPEQLRDYFSASAAVDPNGTWAEVVIDVQETAEGSMLRLHECETSYCDPATGHDREQDWSWLMEDGTAAVDGLVWSLADED